MLKSELESAATDLLCDCEMLVITCETHAASANAMLAHETKLRNQGEKLRKEEKEPHLRKCQEIDASFKTIQDILAKCQGELKPKVNSWLQAEKLRKQAEAKAAQDEAERAHEKAMAMMEAQGNGSNGADALDVAIAIQEAETAERSKRQSEFDARKTSITGGGVNSRSLKEVWSIDVIDAVALVQALVNNSEVQAAAIKVAQGMVKGAKGALVLAGVKPICTETI